MILRTRIPPTQLRALFIAALAFLLHAAPALAGLSYSLDQTHAAAGEMIKVKAVVFNNTDNTLNWKAPQNLVLQWRNERGQVIRSLARLETGNRNVNVPVNNFVQFLWRAVVPSRATGLQAVSIEGEPALLALDTTPLAKSPIADTPANVPVIDAGAAKTPHGADPRLPDNVVAATGASITQGPAVNSAGTGNTTASAFDKFTSAISPYDPVYFDVGRNDETTTTARFQLSFKYRLFTPADATKPSFADHLYLGYTQTTLWDLAGNSRPFIDTTYNPSLFWQKDSLWRSPKNNWFAGLTTGLEHRSNGKGGPDSRSMNDAFVQPELNYRFDGGSTLTFAPRLKTYMGMKQNPDYADFAGRVDWKLRWAQDNGLVLSGLYRQGQQGRRTTQLEAAWPLQRTFLHMNGYLHIQYFNGYGETLLGYNQRTGPQVRFGLSLAP
jgi:outer membrane phospholipase A